ncbi:hypothetical protein [Corynebacterium pseudodiphtheriticum]|uniref:hypothetical protein n=1 Tax=Corynebacterium pseudodiphtheriticum TaxID=37637 RepID=UPI0020C088EA|nr:hypothetical protein [Corynebacterium pseudodiphtheriticum]UQV55630.1 hypothetical protein L9H27_07545 [Corynebacterium pseudodiphtheriticum]
MSERRNSRKVNCEPEVVVALFVTILEIMFRVAVNGEGIGWWLGAVVCYVVILILLFILASIARHSNEVRNLLFAVIAITAIFAGLDIAIDNGWISKTLDIFVFVICHGILIICVLRLEKKFSEMSSRRN